MSFFQQDVSACWRFLFNLFIICKFNKRLNRRRDITLCFAEISRTLSFPSPKPSCLISFCWITLQTCNLVLQNIADMYGGKEAMHLLPSYRKLEPRVSTILWFCDFPWWRKSFVLFLLTCALVRKDTVCVLLNKEHWHNIIATLKTTLHAKYLLFTHNWESPSHKAS